MCTKTIETEIESDFNIVKIKDIKVFQTGILHWCRIQIFTITTMDIYIYSVKNIGLLINLKILQKPTLAVW